MSGSKIFFLGDGESGLTSLTEAPYDTEDVLQALLARYPDLLPGDQIDPENPRRWLLVSREMAVPDDEDSVGRWSLDHLLLDQDAIPTFVECKRATDTRSRREVVAQMLDYAANGIEYWSIDRLRHAAGETARGQGKSLDEEIRRLTGAEDQTGIEAFWQRAEENLRSGRVRLVFVADKTPRELRRLVEFLNEHMPRVEVLAVEIRQYLGTGGKALVSRVVGMTEAARAAKRPDGLLKRPTNRAEFLAKCDGAGAAFFTQVLDEAERRGYAVNWGTVGFSVRARLPKDDQLATFVYGYPDGKFEFYFGYLQLSGTEGPALRSKLLACGVFEEAGEHTLRANVNGQVPLALPSAYQTILAEVEGILKSRASVELAGDGGD
jgi:hypothetical protein